MKRVDVTYVLLFDEQEKNVLMVKNKGDHFSYYTLPGGAVEPEETLAEAAIREVKEETGLDVEIDGVFSVSEAFFEERGHHAIFFTFRGKIIGGDINISMPDEIEEITWMDSQEAEEYIHITNSKGLIKSKSSVPYLLRERVIRKS
ncbi:NUDIX hydrolase [Metabacillus halosaccharovorans]|uniref:NUDIX hydrolase n=1 Tax=Metabacillus halosaccharovorans TaxID=930124 RepID=UPI000994B921|nr:NUDIX hydrolase [Metabacillus halosaccharovorans]